jgi:hypothetical protein
VFSDEGAARAAEILGRIGLYPHAALKLERKTQATRMIKLECPQCGYVARTTKQWLEQVGALRCPCALVLMDVAGDVNVAAVTPQTLARYEQAALEILGGIHGEPAAKAKRRVREKAEVPTPSDTNRRPSEIDALLKTMPTDEATALRRGIDSTIAELKRRSASTAERPR